VVVQPSLELRGIAEGDYLGFAAYHAPLRSPSMSRKWWFSVVGIRYLLLTYNAPGGKEIWAAMSAAERQAEEDDYTDLIRAMRESDVFIAACEVEYYDAACTVRIRDGVRSVSDGPAVAAEEFLTGYFLIEAGSLDAAIDWAAKIPNARSGSVEVRPVMVDQPGQPIV
jgi:hypothetical protein